MRKLLEQQANHIEAVLTSHGIARKVWGGIVTPRFVRFRLAIPLGTRLDQITQLSGELAQALGVPSTRVYHKDSAIQVELPRRERRVVRLLPICQRLRDVPELTAVLGLDEEGTPLLVRLSSPEVAHMLIGGEISAGKSALARTMLLSLAMHNAPAAPQLVLVDLRGHGLLSLAHISHLMVLPVQELERAEDVLEKLVAEVERRERLEREKPYIVLAIDELSDLMRPGRQRSVAALTRLTQSGSGAGVHVIACTQKPAVITNGLAETHFPLRLVGSVASPADARVAAGVKGTGAEKLLGRGDFLLVHEGQTVRFQAAWVDEGEIRSWKKKQKAGGRKRKSILSLSPLSFRPA